ncbi:MAG: metallophosphoesterase [Pseudomonadales bacterium]|jgi:hypothetical protein|nr:metallophosphoesterase [Pseudomonadales bacterium]
MICAALRTLLLALASFGLQAAAEAGGADDAWRHPAVDRLVVFGDVHGDHDALFSLLRAAAVIDADGAWVAGETHLVSLGDLLDRGPDSRRVMDLLMRLQQEAAAAGGRVHVLVGNHELMNLAGDLRYVAPEEYAAFAGAEDDRLRAEALDQARRLGIDDAKVNTRPPGFFAHRAAFLPEGTYGAWLLAQRTLVVIGDMLFAHGGASPVLLEGPVETIEGRIRARLRELVAFRSDVRLARPDRLDVGLFATSTLGAADARLGEDLAPLADEPFFGPSGPFWYRGTASCHPLLEAPVLRRTLAGLDVEAVAVGHTPQRDGRIHSRLDGSVLLLDTGMLARYYGGRPRALVIEDGVRRVVSPDGDQQRPEPLYPAVDAGLDAATLARVLERGGMTSLGDDRVRLELDGTAVEARVLALRERARSHARAARRLDEILGLGMVPAVVEREVEGELRLLEVDAGRWLPEGERAGRGIVPPADCFRGHAFDLVRLFDALLGKRRSPEELSWSLPSLSIRLTGNDDAFPRARRVQGPEAAPPAVVELLRRVDEARLREGLAGLLEPRRLDALVARRAALLSELEES